MTIHVLGNARRGGTIKYALEALRRVRECGEAALLLSRTGDVVFVPHWSREYTEAINRPANLCGVYRTPDADEKLPITAADVCADLIERWRELREVAA